MLPLRVQSGVNLRGVNTSYLTIVYIVAQASLIVAIIKYRIYLYLDRKQQYYISMYKVFVNNLFKLNIRALKYNLRLSRTFANQYRKSKTSKQRVEEFKSFEAVIKFLATVPKDMDMWLV